MDRLLGIDPHELIFDFEIGQRCTSFVTLKNVMFTMPVAFRITAPAKKYTVKPAQGIIPPAGRVTVEVSMNPQPYLPETFLISADKFVIKSVVVPGGNQHSSVSNEWFESKKHYVYSDSGLRVLLIGECILRALVSKGSMEDVREMLERGVDSKNRRRNSSGGGDESAMHLAISNGRPEMVQLLLEFGADLEMRDRAGKTALHEAAASGQSLIAELLLAKGAKTESPTESGGWTALHFAVNGRHVDTVRVLLAKGANVNARVGAENRTALHIAAAAGGSGAAECLKLLLECGAAVNAVTSSGVTALHIAAGQGDLTAVRLLLDHGAMRDVVDAQGHIPFDAAMEEHQGRNTLLDLLKLGDDLRRAARKGDLKSVKNCLKLGADVNGKDQNGWAAVHCAAFKGHVEVVKKLLDKGANLNSVDSDGYTPLHCAVEMGHSEVVQILQKKGVDLNAQNRHGLTAVQVGNAMDQAGVARLLVEAGARNVNMSAATTMGKSKGFCDAADAPSKKLFNESLNGRRLSCETFG